MAQVSFEQVSSFNETLKKAVASTPPFNLTHFPSVIELSANNAEIELGRVISESAGNILAVFGIDDNNNFTISFLPLDGDKKIITSADGEEHWPSATVTNFPAGVDAYLP